MTQFSIHNVRFYDFEPKAIHCMVYEDATSQLALSRSDNSIEIWDCRQHPYCNRVIPGCKDRTVEALRWIDNRLFSAGLNGHVTEYDLDLLIPKFNAAVTGGPTWCLALSKDKKKLAAGTEEGIVCLFDVTDDGLLYDRTLHKQEGRVLCMAWHSDGQHIVTGSVDAVRLFSLSGSQVTGFKVGRTVKSNETIVWSVALLDDMTIVTADSRGKTSFWDGKLGTLFDSVTTHKADVLCLQVAADQQSLYVGGVDSQIVQVCRVTPVAKKGRRVCWVRGVKRHLHTHDVRSMALTQDNKLYSGGVDTELAVSYGPPRVVHKFACCPSDGSISVASASRSVALRYDNRVELWRLGTSQSADDISHGAFIPLVEDRVKLLELRCRGEEMIESCSVSPSGIWLAYLTQQRLPKIFRFYPPEGGKGGSVHRVRVVSEEAAGTLRIVWLSDGRLACICGGGVIKVLSVSEDEATVSSTLSLPSGGVARLLSVSQCGSLLVVADSKDEVVVLNVSTGSVRATLPRRSSAPTAVAVHPSTKDVVVVYADNCIIEYSVKMKRYTDFSRRLVTLLPADWNMRSSAVSGVTLCSNQPHLILLHDSSSFIVIDKRKDAEEPRPGKVAKIQRGDANSEKSATGRNKNASSIGSITTSGAVCQLRRPHLVLHMSVMNGHQHTEGGSSTDVASLDDELLSVELNSLLLLDKLPPPFKQKTYGGV